MSGRFSEKGKTEEEIKEIRKKKGKSSRNRGARAEWDLAKLFNEYGFEDAERTAQRRGKEGGDADVIGVPYLHIESKYVERLNLDKAMEQGERDCRQANKLAIPVVCHRKPHQHWKITLDLEYFLQMWSIIDDADKEALVIYVNKKKNK